MNETTLLLILGGAALFFLSSKKGGGASKQSSSPTMQTSPSSRNPAVGIGNGPNSLNTEISNVATAATNGINALGGLYKGVTGLGSSRTPTPVSAVGTANTPGQSVPSLPGTTTATGGNDSFDAQDDIANMSGADHSDYADDFIYAGSDLNPDNQIA